MAQFVVDVPFDGEALHVFKLASDVHTYVELAENPRTTFDVIDNETAKISFSVTLGVFRLLLDGHCTLVDRDFDAHTSIMTLETKDRGGKGKVNATIRLLVDDDTSTLTLDCDVTTLGMLKRVELPLEKIVHKKVTSFFYARLEHNVPESTADASEHMTLDESDARVYVPAWLSVLQFPGKIFMLPYRLMRQLSAIL